MDEKISALEKAQSEKLKDITEKKTALEKQLRENPQDMNLQVEISRLETELAAGTASVRDSSQAANILESKNEILKLLAGGDTGDAVMSRISSHVDALETMLEDGSPLALAAMKEVYAKMLAKSVLGDTGTEDGLKETEGAGTENEDGGNPPPETGFQTNSAYDALLEEIEMAVSESAVSAGLTGELSPADAEAALADALGVGRLLNPDGSVAKEALAGASNEDIAASLLALGDFNKKAGAQNQTQALARGLAAALEQSPDMAVFQSKKEGAASYVPAETLASYLKYRYVWNETKRNAVLSRGSVFYSFTAYDSEVRTGSGETLQMDSPAGFAGQLFIPGSFAESRFGCYIYDISGTEYSVLVNDKVVEKSREILSVLLEKGGY